MYDKEYRRQHYLKNKEHTLAINRIWAHKNLSKGAKVLKFNQ